MGPPTNDLTRARSAENGRLYPSTNWDPPAALIPLLVCAMKTLEIPYPEDLLDETGETPGEFERKLRFLVAAKLYELGRVTSGRAADIAGMQRVPFLNELGRYRISVVNYSADELSREIEEAKQRARDE